MDKDDKHLPTSRSNSLTKSATQSVRRALADRMLLSEAVDLVGKLIAAFPNGGQAAGKGYIGALASTLCSYPRLVALRCADPVLGVACETRFLPTVADLVAWCERETAAMRKPVEREDRDTNVLRAMAVRRDEGEYWQKARAVRPNLEELRAKHGPSWGIENQGDDLAAKKQKAAAIQAANERAWSKMGGTVSAGIPITEALLATMGATE